MTKDKSRPLHNHLLLLFSLLLLPVTSYAQKSIPPFLAPDGYLDSFWLECERAKTTDKSVSIIHLGDSHVQAGHFTTTIRQAFINEWGNGGVGLISALHLLKKSAPSLPAIRATAQGTSSFKITQRDYNYSSPTGMLLEVPANRPITYTLQCGSDQTFDRVIIYRQYDSLPFSLSGETAIGVSHDTLTAQLIVIDSLLLGHFVNSVQITAPASSTWYGASLERSSGGVIVHTLGYNGATYHTYDKGAFTSSVKALAPHLIILSLGTNESIFRNFDRNKFAEQVATVVHNLRESNPNCPIILTSPLYNYRQVRTRSRGKHKRRYTSRYKANPNCTMIAKELRRQAKGLRCGYIDLFSYFGGEQRASRPQSDGMLSADHIHLTAKGYELLGQAVADALIADYQHWASESTLTCS